MAAISPLTITGDEEKADLSTPYGTLVQFYHGFNHQKIDVMAQNWLQNESASMSNPLGGIKRGWTEILSVYETIFNGSAQVYVEYYDYSIEQSDTMFLAVGRERGFFQSKDMKIDLKIRTSRLYTKAASGWQQLHHHGSIESPDLLKAYQNAVSST